METEVGVLKRLTESPERPYAVVLGGAKVSDKLGVIDNLLQTADRLLIRGGMVFTFLKAQDYEVGSSLLESDQVDTVGGYLEQAKERGVEIVTPVDIVAATEFSADADYEVVPAGVIPADFGWASTSAPSRASSSPKLKHCKTVFWNGPMGAFEMEPYAAGHGRRRGRRWSRSPTRAGSPWWEAATPPRHAPARNCSDDQFGHISTGGGASLGTPGRQLRSTTVLDEQEGLMAPKADSRTPLMAGNWSEPRPPPACLVQKLDWTLRDGKHDFGAVEVAVLPPFTDLRIVQTLIDGDRLELRHGAQDLSAHDSGAYTGEVSGAFLAKLGCTYDVIGHSERRGVPRRDRRGRQRQAQGGVPARAHPDLLRGGGARGAPGRRPRGACSPRSRPVSTGSPPSRRRPS